MNALRATPWKVTGQSWGGRYIKVTDANGRTVARVPFSSDADGIDGTATDASDAALIAAAPDLLAVLTLILRDNSEGLSLTVAAMALDAVRKAKEGA